VDREHSILLTRYQGNVYAFSMVCPHQRAAVKWLEDQHIFQCTKHKSKYSEGGTYISGRATRSLDRHPLRVANGQVVVDETTLLKEDADAAAWKAAVCRTSRGGWTRQPSPRWPASARFAGGITARAGAAGRFQGYGEAGPKRGRTGERFRPPERVETEKQYVLAAAQSGRGEFARVRRRRH
jgi:nitrite reductase/ring-hydroxylating ferredoxin subunit